MSIEELFSLIRSAPVKHLLHEVVRPAIHGDKKTLVYPLPLAARIGHLGPEPHYLLTLFADTYEQIAIMTPPRSEPGINQALYDQLSERFTMIETEHQILLRLSLTNDGIVAQDGFDLLSCLSPRLYRDYAVKRRANGPRFYTLGEELSQKGADWLDRLGAGRDRPFVTLHVRDAGHVPEEKYRRYGEIRAASLHHFRPAVQWLLDNGYAVLRIGGEKDEPLGVEHPFAIDVPFLPDHEDWMDVYLCGACDFSVNCQSGPEALVRGFGKRSLNTNLTPTVFGHHLDHDLFLYKSIHSGNSGQALTYPEILSLMLPTQMTAAQLPNVEFYENNNLSVRENHPEVLLAAVREMAASSPSGPERFSSPLQEQFVRLSQEFQSRIAADPVCVSRFHDVYPHAFGWGKLAEAQLLQVPGFA